MALPNHSKEGSAQWRRRRNKKYFHQHRVDHTGWVAPAGATTHQDPKSNRSKRRKSGERGFKNK